MSFTNLEATHWYTSLPLFQETPEEEEELITKKDDSSSVRYNQPDADLCQDIKVTNIESLPQQNTYFRAQDSNAEENTNLQLKNLSELCSRITKLDIPNYETSNEFATEPSCNTKPQMSPIYSCYESAKDSFPQDDGYESAEDSFLTEEDFMFLKMNLFDKDQEEEDDDEPIPKEKIMRRIDSHKGMKSYQLANQLSSKWTTGAGPRIGCMRDYPSELQFRVLEHANLSPRYGSANSTPPATSRFSPMASTSTTICRERASRNPLVSGQVL